MPKPGERSIVKEFRDAAEEDRLKMIERGGIKPPQAPPPPEPPTPPPAPISPAPPTDGFIPEGLTEEPDPGAPPPAPSPVPQPDPNTPGNPPPPKPDEKTHEANLAAMRRAHAAEIQSLKDQLERAKQGPVDELAALRERNASLQKQLDEISSEIGRVNIRKHPAYVAKFITPQQQIRQFARNLATKASLNPDDIEKLFEKDPRERGAWLSKNAPDLAAQMAQAFNQYDMIAAAAEDEVTNWNRAQSNLDEEARRDQEAQLQRGLRELRSTVIEESRQLSRSGMFGWTPAEDEEGAPEEIQLAMNKAGEVIMGKDLRTKIRLMLRGAILERYEARVKKQAQLIDELMDELRSRGVDLQTWRPDSTPLNQPRQPATTETPQEQYDRKMREAQTRRSGGPAPIRR